MDPRILGTSYQAAALNSLVIPDATTIWIIGFDKIFSVHVL